MKQTIETQEINNHENDFIALKLRENLFNFDNSFDENTWFEIFDILQKIENKEINISSEMIQHLKLLWVKFSTKNEKIEDIKSQLESTLQNQNKKEKLEYNKMIVEDFFESHPIVSLFSTSKHSIKNLFNSFFQDRIDDYGCITSFEDCVNIILYRIYTELTNNYNQINQEFKNNNAEFPFYSPFDPEFKKFLSFLYQQNKEKNEFIENIQKNINNLIEEKISFISNIVADYIHPSITTSTQDQLHWTWSWTETQNIKSILSKYKGFLQQKQEEVKKSNSLEEIKKILSEIEKIKLIDIVDNRNFDIEQTKNDLIKYRVNQEVNFETIFQVIYSILLEETQKEWKSDRYQEIINQLKNIIEDSFGKKVNKDTNPDKISFQRIHSNSKINKIYQKQNWIMKLINKIEYI